MLLLNLYSFAQAPEVFKYQAIINKKNGNEVLKNTSIGVQISIIHNDLNGTPVYSETFNATTNGSGLINLEIGNGSPTIGDFSEIDWVGGPYFLVVGVDITGGSHYISMGGSQLLSVPYALYANTAKSISEPIVETQSLADVTAIDNSVNAQIKNLTNPTEDQDAATKAYVDVHSLADEDIDSNNEIELPIGGTNGQVLQTDGSGNYSWVNLTMYEPTYSVNTFYAELGGYVIEVSDGGKHGLVAAMQDQVVGNSTTGPNWYEINDFLSNADNHDINGAKFKDWRIPTKRELNLMYLSKTAIGITSGSYWSATEASVYSSYYRTYSGEYAWFQKFYSGVQGQMGKKSAGGMILRAVRSF